MRGPGGVPEAKFLEHLVAEIFPKIGLRNSTEAAKRNFLAERFPTIRRRGGVGDGNARRHKRKRGVRTNGEGVPAMRRCAAVSVRCTLGPRPASPFVR